MKRTKPKIVSGLPLLALALFVFTPAANADITLSYGTLDGNGMAVITLLPNTPNQVVEFFATGVVADGGSTGMELDLQVGDGGAFLGGNDVGPIIGPIDLITGTIWAAAGASQQDNEDHPLIKQSTVDTANLVSADGLVGTVAFDTTGFSMGSFDFRVNGVAEDLGGFDTTFFRNGVPLPTTSFNGSLRISSVPEPSSFMVVGALGLLGLARRRRSK